jgi:hypothetical protein
MKNKEETLGQKLSPLLAEIEMTLWESEAMYGLQPRYTEEGFRAAVKIFMSAIMDKMYDVQRCDGMSLDDMANMATSCGQELSKFVHTYTGINTKELYAE